MTGKYPARLGITDWIGAGQKREALVTPMNESFLPLEEITIGEAMKAGGYKTAYFGKWHVGGFEEGQGRAGLYVVPPEHRGAYLPALTATPARSMTVDTSWGCAPAMLKETIAPLSFVVP